MKHPAYLPVFSDALPSGSHTGVRLCEFIRQNTDQIVEEWENFARSLNAGANLVLHDYIRLMLQFIIGDIQSPQTDSEQVTKSRGEKKRDSSPTAAENHASVRLSGGFNIDQLVTEYRALRACVIKLWSAVNTAPDHEDLLDLIRFNESIDQELAESVSYYTHTVNHSRDLMFGIVSHDLRTPLGAIHMCAQLILRTDPLAPNQRTLAAQIKDSTSRTFEIIDDLLDVTRVRFGCELPMNPAPMNMGAITTQLVEEVRVANPSRTITLRTSGDLDGVWDKVRVGQVLSNLISNAIHYSAKDTGVAVVLEAEADDVVLTVHNNGKPIPAEKLATIFDSLSRGGLKNSDLTNSTNLGLGLYIVKNIVVRHGGEVSVTSSHEAGTTFTARFPRIA